MNSKVHNKITVDFLNENPRLEFIELINQAIHEIENLKINDSAGWIRSYISKMKNSPTYPLDISLVNKYLPQHASICEYGAAPFVLTKALSLRGFDITGIDLAPERFKYLDKLKINIVKCNVDNEPLPLQDNYFDAVIFNELFEHLRGNLVFTMQEVYRILKPGGILFLSTPNLKSLVGVINFFLRNKSYSCASDLFHEWNKINTIGHMGHVREYTAIEVSEFLSKSGFSIDCIIYRGSYKNMSKKLKLLSIPFYVLPNLKSWLKSNFTVVAFRPSKNYDY
ncbi:class I SAM-dependent methyltransferase [Myxosarcina sp. GI1(2024)]